MLELVTTTAAWTWESVWGRTGNVNSGYYEEGGSKDQPNSTPTMVVQGQVDLDTSVMLCCARLVNAEPPHME